MKKKSAMIKLIIVGIVALIGVLFTFIWFPAGVNNFQGFIYSINRGLDLQGGYYAVYETNENADGDNFNSDMSETVIQISRFLGNKGYAESAVVREGTSRIRIEVPDADELDVETILTVIGEPATVTFKLSSTKETIITSEDVESTGYYYDTQYTVALVLNEAGKNKFATATANNAGKNIDIEIKYADGETESTTLTISSAITNGVATISNNYTRDKAVKLADQLMCGTFSASLGLTDLDEVAPTLGENALLAVILGVSIAFLLIVAFMCIYYRGLGFAASFSTVIFMVLFLMLLALMPWAQLTLPGIAGIMLSLAMTVIGNIIVFERIKGEFKIGKSILAAYYAGYKKATFYIADSNIAIFVIALLLLIFGVGPLKGFGFILFIGIMLSAFTTLIATRFILKWFLQINDTNREAYGLKRMEGFDETREEQYIAPKKTDAENADSVRLVDGMIPEGLDNE